MEKVGEKFRSYIVIHGIIYMIILYLMVLSITKFCERHKVKQRKTLLLQYFLYLQYVDHQSEIQSSQNNNKLS